MSGASHAPADDAQARRMALYSVLGEIPPGKVVSYGQLAELAGLGRAARCVVSLRSGSVRALPR